ncbi:uncharacterized protein LOC125653620 isoform X2 [Ostrea edulis]|uniref:uncharacterized protein LOC125653620 isoform X2 n=1 Tax=Ostrea edulis TaxID=37623 RepID=UPI0024AED8E2|nr:uncharacterized protein LOC125653620 isoform X2 [Ostrea edulis]
MASSYTSTPETTNANRTCRVVLGPCTDGLRDVLRQEVPPHTFHHVIKQNKFNLPRLTAVQCDLILPKNGNYMGRYNDIDISLLYILLRNITNISPHSNGWGNDPDPHDTSLSANIERIRLVRNRCVHSCDPFMSNADFTSIWSTIRSTMVDLDSFLMNGNKYEKAVDFLRHESMDPENDLHYEEELRKQVEEDKTTREIVVNLESKIDETAEEARRLDGKIEENVEEARRLDGMMKETHKRVDKMEKLTKSPIPPNVREQYDIDVEKWREEDKLYYETHSFPSVMQKVRNQRYVTFVGVPGSGKSATAHHIALKLQEEGYEVVPTKDVRKMEDYGDPRNPQVFVIDDVVGVFGLQKTELYVLTSYEEKITQNCMANSRTLMTCREAVFNETLPYKSFLTKEKTVIKLHSGDNVLDNNDKKQILKTYGLNVDLMSPASLKSTSDMFPLLCKLFSKETKFRALGSKFFLNPVQCIIDELDDMQKHNKQNYATLVLCMLNENSLSKDFLKDMKNEHFMNMKIDTLGNCELQSQTDAFTFVKALSAMEGTYTKQCGAQYTFIHDSMFEICAYQYGKQFPDQMLLYMSSSYIANYVKPQAIEPGIVNKINEKLSDSQSIEGNVSNNDRDQKEKERDDKTNEREESFDLCITVHEDQYSLLAERLYRDIQNMELYDVFRNQVLKHPQVCQAFIGVLETLTFTELKFLFLSKQENVVKIVSKKKNVLEESENEWEWSENLQLQEMLVCQKFNPNDMGVRSCDGNTYNVRVISWVIYYGHYQILEYILQQTEQHSDVSELFEIKGASPQQSKHWIFTKIMNTIFNRGQREEKLRLLLLSCYSGDVQTVRVLLPVCKTAINEKGRIIDCIHMTKYIGSSPLTAACEEGHLAIVEELVKAGADVNLQYRQGNIPLIPACKGGHVIMVKALLKAGAYINVKDNEGNTPLIAACDGEHVSVVKELVKAGADVNIPSRWGNTSLIAACKGGHVGMVKALVKAGADVNLQDRLGNTPLIVACKGGHVSMVTALVKAGACINLIAGYYKRHLSMVKAETDANLQDNEGTTSLIAACQGGHASVVEELLKAGADVNLQGNYRNTPLIAACEGGHVSLVEKLVKAGADVNLQSRWGNTPLIAAVRKCSLSAVKYLVEHGADWVTQIVDIDVSAVYTALIYNKPDIMKYLIQEQNKILPDTMNGNVHLFNCLVDIRHAGVKIDSRDGVVVTNRSVWCMDRWGYLWKTISEGDCDVLRHLLCVGLDVNQSIQLFHKYKDDNKSVVRPLLYTFIDMYLSHSTDVRILLGMGTDVNVRMKYREYDSVLDRVGVSCLERTRRLLCEYSNNQIFKVVYRDRLLEFKKVLYEIKQHVRRHSV